MSKYPVSSEILYLRHSKARVLVPSNKHFITGYDHNGFPTFSRELQDVDVIANEAKRWSKK